MIEVARPSEVTRIERERSFEPESEKCHFHHVCDDDADGRLRMKKQVDDFRWKPAWTSEALRRE